MIVIGKNDYSWLGRRRRSKEKRGRGWRTIAKISGKSPLQLWDRPECHNTA